MSGSWACHDDAKHPISPFRCHFTLIPSYPLYPPRRNTWTFGPPPTLWLRVDYMNSCRLDISVIKKEESVGGLYTTVLFLHCILLFLLPIKKGYEAAEWNLWWIVRSKAIGWVHDGIEILTTSTAFSVREGKNLELDLATYRISQIEIDVHIEHSCFILTIAWTV